MPNGIGIAGKKLLVRVSWIKVLQESGFESCLALIEQELFPLSIPELSVLISNPEIHLVLLIRMNLLTGLDIDDDDGLLSPVSVLHGYFSELSSHRRNGEVESRLPPFIPSIDVGVRPFNRSIVNPENDYATFGVGKANHLVGETCGLTP
jgi:hypothetical protein